MSVRAVAAVAFLLAASSFPQSTPNKQQQIESHTRQAQEFLKANRPDQAKAELMTEDEMRKQVSAAYGDKTAPIVEACRKVYPGAKPVEVVSILSAIGMFRANAVLQAGRKTAQGKAAAYLYQFCWKTPVLDGRPRAFHCSEIPFVFYNTDVSAFCTGGGPEPRALAAKVSDAWVNFARKGDPNHAGLPEWPKFNADKGPMMIFDKTCEVKEDPDRELRKLLADASPASRS